MSRRRRAPWLLAGTGLVLAVALAVLARPQRIWALAARARGSELLIAFTLAAGVATCRGVRLSLVTGGLLGPARASAVVALNQLAVGLLPWRLGELALLPLLQAAGIPGTLRGLSYLVVVRAMDVLALLVWAAVAATLLAGHPLPALLALIALTVVLLAGWRLGGRWLAANARRWRECGGWRRRRLRQLLAARRDLRRAARSPLRLAGVAACSLAAWGGIWAMTLALLSAMGRPWPAGGVLAGTIGAAVGSSLPFNALGSFGTQEAGWTAALAATGVPADAALPAGFATHLWGLVFATLLGIAAVPALAFSQSGRAARTLRASASNNRASAGDA